MDYFYPLHKPHEWRKPMEEYEKNTNEGRGEGLCKWRMLRKMMIMMMAVVVEERGDDIDKSIEKGG